MKNNFKKNIIICLIFFVVILIGLSVTLCKNEPVKKKENAPDKTVEVKEKKIDAVTYKMDISLDEVENTLTETVTIVIQNNTEKAVSELCIRDMTPEILEYCEKYYGENNKNTSTEILSITLEDEVLDFSFGKDKSIIYVQLGENGTIQRGETKSVTVKMKTDIPNRADRFGYKKTKKGKLYALSFCFPYLADNEDGEWQTDPYFDDGESRSWDLADYYVTFDAPENYMVAATGNSNTVNEKTTIEAKNVRDFAIVACDFMEKETFEVEGIKVNNYYLDGKYTNEYRNITNLVAKDSIEIFTEEVGKYPYEELDIVPCLFGYAYGGMEYPGLVMSNASSFFSGSFFDAYSLANGISHEIAHQWFYASVGNREYSEGWLDEGFATLLEMDIYGLTPCESQNYGETIDEYYLTIKEKEINREETILYAREYFKDIYLDVSPDNYPEEQNYGTAEYEGGYAFLQEVRLQLGDDRFSEFIKEYYETFYMECVKTEDVLTLIRKYDDSEKMNEIINFYFKR